MAPVLRLARRLRWVFAATTVMLLLVAVGLFLRATSVQPEIRGEGPAGSPVPIHGVSGSDAQLLVLADARPPGETLACSVVGDNVVFPTYFFPERTVGSRTLYELGKTGRGTTDAQQVLCPADGFTTVVLLQDAGGQQRTLALGLAGGSALLARWTVVVFVLARLAPRPRAAGPTS